jgi:hypothetical protein
MAGALAGDVEALRVLVHGGVTVGGRRVGDDHRAGRDGVSGEFDVRECDPDRADHDRGMTHQFLDRIRCEFEMLGQQCPLVGMVA